MPRNASVGGHVRSEEPLMGGEVSGLSDDSYAGVTPKHQPLGGADSSPHAEDLAAPALSTTGASSECGTGGPAQDLFPELVPPLLSPCQHST